MRALACGAQRRRTQSREGVQANAHIGHSNPKERLMIDPTQKTVDTLIEMNEPEALLATIRREAERKSGPRWQALALVLGEAETKLDQLLNAKPADKEADAA
jgi:hypothetical protein